MSERTIRHREDGPRRFTRLGVDIDTEPGEEATVDSDVAAELVDEQEYFEYVDESEADGDSGDDGSSDDGSTEGESSSDGEPDAGADSTSGSEGYEFDGEDAWFDDHDDYQARIERVESGDVDDHLDTIANIETSDQVKDAVGVRRAEIEG